jgi:hypothetical protein
MKTETTTTYMLQTKGSEGWSKKFETTNLKDARTMYEAARVLSKEKPGECVRGARLVKRTEETVAEFGA